MKRIILRIFKYYGQRAKLTERELIFLLKKKNYSKLIQKYIFNNIYPTIRACIIMLSRTCKIINNINKRFAANKY